MKVKLAWYFGGVLILGLTVLVTSCNSSFFPRSTPEPPVATIAPPLIPHPIEGRADCRLCHEAGIGGAPQFPVATHSQRPSDVCLACHEPASSKKVEGTLTAEELYNNRCAACHGAKRQGVPGLGKALTPESLAALSDDQIRETMSDGRLGTAMPAFRGSLSPAEIEALLQLIKHTKP